MKKRARGNGRTPQEITDLLNRCGKSQAQISRESGVAISTVNRYWHGIGEPTMSTLQRLADYFGETFVIEIKPRKTKEEVQP